MRSVSFSRIKGEGNLDPEGPENELWFCHWWLETVGKSLYLFKPALHHLFNEGLPSLSALKWRGQGRVAAGAVRPHGGELRTILRRPRCYLISLKCFMLKFGIFKNFSDIKSIAKDDNLSFCSL